jgi:hypothetical protein
MPDNVSELLLDHGWIDLARGIVVLPAPAQGLLVELRLKKDSAEGATRMLRNARREDGAGAHRIVAKGC